MSFFKSVEPIFKRETISKCKGSYTVELSFNAGVELGKGNPSKTEVLISCFNNDEKRKKLIWAKEIGNVPMPTASWHGLSIIVIHNNNVIVGYSNEISCYRLFNGSLIWNLKFKTGVVKELFLSKENDSLYTYTAIQSLKANKRISNISKLDLGGQLLWEAEKPGREITYTGPPKYYEGELMAHSSDSHSCFINQKTGKIEKKFFSKV
ncbi:MAG: hypothetical protein KDI92_12520 [Xanthomonadales bacterium]|nr:hypothetical protein [Xanthomonadales bacterium]